VVILVQKVEESIEGFPFLPLPIRQKPPLNTILFFGTTSETIDTEDFVALFPHNGIPERIVCEPNGVIHRFTISTRSVTPLYRFIMWVTGHRVILDKYY